MVSGGACFIGSAVVRYLMGESKASVLNVDKLTYAGNLDSLTTIADSPDYQPTHVMHLVAESHVDQSIGGPSALFKINIMGTYTLLAVARHCVAQLPGDSRDAFRFHYISTNEVYGGLVGVDALFTEVLRINQAHLVLR